MSLATRKAALETASIILILVGLAVSLAAWSGTSQPATLLADIVFWPPDGGQSLSLPEQRLLSAISGGVMVGWGTTILILVRDLFFSTPHAVKNIVAAGVSTWFAVDSVGSLVAGAPVNVALNLVFLALFLVPLRGKIASASHI